MIKVSGHEFHRGGVQIGFISDEWIKDRHGDRIGYYLDTRIFDKSGHKLAYLQNDYIHFTDSSKKIRIEDNNQEVVGGDLNNIQRAAARVLFGE